MMLTRREGELVALIQQGKLNKEIAHDLGLTIGTVKEYVFRLARKAGVRNRTEIAMWGVRQRETNRRIATMFD